MIDPTVIPPARAPDAARTRSRSPAVDVLWCSNTNVRAAGRTWAFPRPVERRVRALTAGQTVLHLFGGRATFGRRLDLDPTVRPDVIGDAWLPPFGRDSFDVVILDPPYATMNAQTRVALMTAAVYIARRAVVWFSTVWLAPGRGWRLERAWLVRVGDGCWIRSLQVFTVTAAKARPPRWFARGPAMRYNRWLIGELPLPFDAPPARELEA